MPFISSFLFSTQIEFAAHRAHYDSDPFEFAGCSWRLTFGRNDHGSYRFLMRPLASVGVRVFCEFRVSCLLKPVYARGIALHFDRSPHWQGLDPFIGPELLSYLQDGRVSLSVRLACTSPT